MSKKQYDRIREKVRGLDPNAPVVQDCWIAHVKELNNDPTWKPHSSRVKSDGSLHPRKKPCPKQWQPLIKKALYG